ncbi:NAD(P)-binding protein [Parathielavia hyrcaniae]|uniref:NAD(P)-binding protein n=1 Tax=Parathielavia hyrcaniae TaxID=113614 RepID=A0AAN6PZC6_9PEZI|nr:NAD(P)-binding protein [Parathielavia hyrcaniae]
MRAWQYSTAAGGLEKHLSLHDSVPLPRMLGDSDLLIQVVAASINPADYKVPELGIVARAVIHTPATPGMDFCGRVVQAAKTVDAFAIGDLVFGRLGPQQHGSLGEYIVAPATACAHVPDGVAPEEAATVGVAGITQYQCIAPNVKPGDKVLINGGSGGTGTFGIQIAKALGCHVTTTCSPGKADLCRSLGADAIIDYTSTDVSQALRSQGQVFALVVDNAGLPDDLYKAADDFLVPEGRFVQVGGPMSLGALKTVTSRLLRPAFLGGGRRKFVMYNIATSQADLRVLGQWMAEKKIRAVIEETYEMGDVPRAFERLKTGRTAGKLVVRVSR